MYLVELLLKLFYLIFFQVYQSIASYVETPNIQEIPLHVEGKKATENV